MKIELENVKPAEIEKRSFEIITEELGDTHLIPEQNRSSNAVSIQAQILIMPRTDVFRRCSRKSAGCYPKWCSHCNRYPDGKSRYQQTEACRIRKRSSLLHVR